MDLTFRVCAGARGAFEAGGKPAGRPPFGPATRCLPAALALALAACGGGGGEPPSQPASTAPPPAVSPSAAAEAAPQPPPAPAPSPAPAPPPDPAATAAAPPKAATFRSGLEHPWGLAFLPDGSMLVTERPGRLRHVSADGATLSEPIAGVPSVKAAGQGGLLDVATDPDFANNRRIYLSYAEPDGELSGTAVARASLSDDHARLRSVTVIFRQSPKKDSAQHFGGRLVFARDGTLFVTLGDRGEWRDEAQNRRNHLGKVVRIATDGSTPDGGPYAGDAAAASGLWSVGHRNVQGAALHPQTGDLWTGEHGPQGGDEINRNLPGRNFGWPVVSYGCEYGASVGTACGIGGGRHAPDYAEPVATWTPTSAAPSGMGFYTGDRFPQWKGSLFVATLAGKAVWRLELDGDTVKAREPLFEELGERIRHVREGPDGWLYLLTDNPAGRIVRVTK